MIPIIASHPKTQSSWHVFDPAGHVLGATPCPVAAGYEVDLHHRERLLASAMVADGSKVYESDRVMCLRACLASSSAATAEVWVEAPAPLYASDDDVLGL